MSVNPPPQNPPLSKQLNRPCSPPPPLCRKMDHTKPPISTETDETVSSISQVFWTGAILGMW